MIVCVCFHTSVFKIVTPPLLSLVTYPLQWSEHDSPRGEPLCERVVFDSSSCRSGLPLEAQARLIYYFFQFQSAFCVPLVAFDIMLGSQYFEFEFVVKVPGGSSFHHGEEEHLVCHTHNNHMSKSSLFTTY